MTSEGTREVQVYPGITGYMAAKGRPFGKEGCSSGPSVIPGEYCIIPGLACSLGILERCSRNVHAQVIPLVESTLILALLLQVSSADSNVPQFLCSYWGFLASAAPVCMQHMKVCPYQVQANRQTVNLLYSCFLKWKRTSALTFLTLSVKNNELVLLHIGICMPWKGAYKCVSC